MTLPPVRPFAEIIRPYRALFFDSYGVLRSQAGFLPGAEELLRSLLQNDKKFWIISNDASVSPQLIADKLNPKAGAPLVNAGQVTSPGMLLTEHLRAHYKGQRAAYLGLPTSEYYLHEAGLHPIPIRDVRAPEDFGVFAMMDEGGFDWQKDLTHAINLIRRKEKVGLFAPNPDTVFLKSETECGVGPGALAALIQAAIEKPLLHFGKPRREIFDFTFEKARAALPDLRRSEVLMVGDSLPHDIQGARCAEIDSVLVLSGNTSAARYREEIEKFGTFPTHIAQSMKH